MLYAPATSLHASIDQKTAIVEIIRDVPPLVLFYLSREPRLSAECNFDRSIKLSRHTQYRRSSNRSDPAIFPFNSDTQNKPGGVSVILGFAITTRSVLLLHRFSLGYCNVAPARKIDRPARSYVECPCAHVMSCFSWAPVRGRRPQRAVSKKSGGDAREDGPVASSQGRPASRARDRTLCQLRCWSTEQEAMARAAVDETQGACSDRRLGSDEHCWQTG
jgi:hypothetical protein